MDEQHHRQSLRRKARTAQIADEFESVACPDRHRLHLDQRRVLESKRRGEQAVCLPAGAIVMEIFQRRVVAQIGDEPMLAVARHAGNGQVARIEARE